MIAPAPLRYMVRVSARWSEDEARKIAGFTSHYEGVRIPVSAYPDSGQVDREHTFTLDAWSDHDDAAQEIASAIDDVLFEHPGYVPIHPIQVLISDVTP